MALHCVEGMGEEKPYFLLCKSVKCQKAPLGHSVSTNFVADCGSGTVPSFWNSACILDS